jgi:hypothetical protein
LIDRLIVLLICNDTGNVLVYWASLDYSSGELLGIEAHNSSWIKPVWLCFNISARTEGCSSLTSDPNLAVSLSDKWQRAFSQHGMIYSSRFHIPGIIGSSEFTFPLLSAEVLFSIILACIISAAGFVLLLVVFTKADLGLTFGGTLAMVTVVAVTVCAHVFVFRGDFDLLDVVVLVAVIGMAVDFPIHFICEFVRQQDKEAERLRRRALEFEAEQARLDIARDSAPANPHFAAAPPLTLHPSRRSIDDEHGMNASWLIGEEILGAIDSSRLSRDRRLSHSSWRNSTSDVMTEQQHRRQQQGQQRQLQDEGDDVDNDTSLPPAAAAKGVSPVLTKTHKHLAVALVAPLILTVLSGLPLLRAELMLLRKCGQYVVLLAVVSYFFCVLILPYYMPLTCRLSFGWLLQTKSSIVAEERHSFSSSRSSSSRHSRHAAQDDEDAHRLTVPLIGDESFPASELLIPQADVAMNPPLTFEVRVVDTNYLDKHEV